MITLNNINLSSINLSGIDLRGIKLGLGGRGSSGDGFPQLPGDVTRWHFGGLTNEMMAAMDDPRIEDADGKGRFLSFKNFAWKEGSGISDIYPGAIVFDGVDDYGICENFPILTKEKGYTVVVLRQWITTPNDNLFYGLMTNGNNRTDGAFVFEDFNRGSKSSFSFGGYTTVESGTLSMPFTYQTSTSYNGKAINIGSLEKGVDIFYVGRMGSRSYYVNAAVWEICILDHDATEEELQKIQDYYKQEYPWLFPDQAWTVTGKTNEDTDRATIANITGNGNNLVLSNFGFAENSGYGDYPINFPSSLSEGQPYGTLRFKTDGKYSNLIKTGVTDIRIKFNLRGMPEGGVLSIRGLDPTTALPITEKSYTVDGLYEFVYNDSAKPVNIVFYNGIPLTGLFDFYVDIIPEYEGYLVTDGVDDKIQSSAFTMGKDFTVVGEWKMLKNSDTYELAGINKYDSFILYNYSHNNRINVYIHSGQGTPINTDSIKAFTSTGLIYIDNFNNVEEVIPRDKTDRGYTLFMGYNNNVFTKLAFKNLAIYSEVLSKEDCIKAYNYLQTLKAK